jgi:F-type H+-transporting ATPase subunit b
MRPLRAALAGALACALAPAAAAAEPGASPNLVAVDFPVLVATIVVFFLVLFVLAKTAWKPILKGLAAREEAIRASVEAAERANEESRRLREDFERRIAHAADEARKIVEEGRKDALALGARIESEAAAEADAGRRRALQDIELARDAALKELHDRVAVLATEVAGKIVEEHLDPAKHRRLVDEAVASYERRAAATGGGRRA